MNIFIVFATYSSGTEVASEAVEEYLNAKGNTVIRKHVKTVEPDELGKFDLVILASPNWWVNKMDGMPHEEFVKFFERAKGKTYPGKKFAVFGLGDTAFDKFCNSVVHLSHFVHDLEGNLLIEPHRIDGFFFNQEENTQKLLEWVDRILQTMV